MQNNNKNTHTSYPLLDEEVIWTSCIRSRKLLFLQARQRQVKLWVEQSKAPLRSSNQEAFQRRLIRCLSPTLNSICKQVKRNVRNESGRIGKKEIMIMDESKKIQWKCVPFSNLPHLRKYNGYLLAYSYINISQMLQLFW